MNYKLIAIDMDGTLLRSDKTLSESTISILKEVMKQGCEIVISTGRCLKELYDIFEKLPEIRYFITTNGALVYDAKEDKVIYENSISIPLVYKIIEASHRKDLMLHILDFECIIEKDKLEHVETYKMASYREMYTKIAKCVDSIDSYFKENEKNIQKINLYHKNKEDRQESITFLSQFDLCLTYAESCALECTANHVNKGIGLQKLSSYLNIDSKQIASIGDSFNDLSMFKTANISFAMGNAQEEVKKQADIVVSDNDHDGVKEAIEYIKNFE